jgi:hypothetical protein
MRGDALGDVRRRLEPTQAVDERSGVISLIGADGDAVPARHGFDQAERGRALGVATGLRQPDLHDQARGVLHQEMAHEAEPRFLAKAFAEQLGLRVSGRDMGGVGRSLAMKVTLAVTPRARGLAAAILRPEALQAGPNLDQRAIDAEVPQPARQKADRGGLRLDGWSGCSAWAGTGAAPESREGRRAARRLEGQLLAPSPPSGLQAARAGPVFRVGRSTVGQARTGAGDGAPGEF